MVAEIADPLAGDFLRIHFGRKPVLFLHQFSRAPVTVRGRLRTTERRGYYQNDQSRFHPILQV
jgi:hypothetical protein